MLRENVTLVFILSCLVALSGLALAWISIVWRKGLSRVPVWMWGGVVSCACYVAFCVPVFYSSTLEYRVSMESGVYAKAYWLVNWPAKTMIDLLAYRGRDHLFDCYLLMPRYVVSVGTALYTAIGCGFGMLIRRKPERSTSAQVSTIE